jgi:FMN-dependent NADH-azoreductase
MSTVLVLKSSVLGDASASNQLVRDAVAQIKSQDPSTSIITRDLVTDPIPHLTPDSASVLRGSAPENPKQSAALTLSNALVDELRAADTIVIGAPMYNFGIASSLKSWFDHVLRAGVTFSYTASGPAGLLHGKRAVVILTRGGFYSSGSTQVLDSQEPHIRSMLNFMGIQAIQFIRAESLAFGQEQRELSMKTARGELEHAIGESVAKAA